MTPGARVQAAIEVLDQIGTGMAAEQALLRWSRASRFAGSKDRAAVRDHVFDALRQRRSAAAMGGGAHGRALMFGLLRLAGLDPATLFTGQGHAPAPLTADEAQAPQADLSPEDAADLPDWLRLRFEADLGPRAPEVWQALRHRAPVFLRVNTAKTTLEAAQAALARDGIEAAPVTAVPTALAVTAGARRVKNSAAFLDGWVELQDASSQAAVAALGLAPGATVLDYCAGGGGKSLAFAAAGAAAVAAHDAEPRRMADIGPRAARAGAEIEVIDAAEKLGGRTFDLVFVDAPCSGSGTWRRTPEAKWRLTPDALAELTDLQSRILSLAAGHVAQGGTLAYATCSVLTAENDAVVDGFLAETPRFRRHMRQQWLPGAQGDGFHLTEMRLE